MEKFDLEDDDENLIDGLYRQGRVKFGPSLRAFAAMQQKRAKNLRATHERLRADLGENDPRVVALGRAAAASEELKNTLETEATRDKRRPNVGRTDWGVFGRVFDARRKPAPGLRVRLYDRDGRHHDLLGEAVTDEFGDFAFVYPKKDYTVWLEGDGTDLFLLVEDSQRNVLYTSQNSVRPAPGRAEYFEVVLGTGHSAPERPAPDSASRKSPAKGRKKKDEK